MARTTIANTIERVRRQLASGHRSDVNVLATSLNSSETTVVLTYDVKPNIVTGALLSIGTETMRVLSVDTAAKSCVVIRGYYDSDGAAHTSGDEVQVNARFQPNDIYDALLDEINSWGPQLYKVVSDTLSVTQDDHTIELPATFIGCHGLIDARRQWTGVVSTAWPRLNCRLIRGVATEWDAVDTSGILLRFIDPVETGDIYVQAAMPFDVSATTTATDLVSDVGLQTSMLDLLAMGMKLRLMMDAENNRTSRASQDVPRRAEESPVAGYVPSAQLNLRMYKDRYLQEINKLNALHPIRVT